MAFGIDDALMLGGSLLGGLLGSKNKGSSTTSQLQLDPRIAGYLYGNGSNPGLLNDVQSLYRANPTGLNQNQTAGLEMQRQSLLDPGYTQGYGAMRGLGLSLLGGGVAGNPFGSTVGNLGLSGYQNPYGGVKSVPVTASPTATPAKPVVTQTTTANAVPSYQEILQALARNDYSNPAVQYLSQGQPNGIGWGPAAVSGGGY